MANSRSAIYEIIHTFSLLILSSFMTSLDLIPSIEFLF